MFLLFKIRFIPLDSAPTGVKNLRTQIWGGKDRVIEPEEKVSKEVFFDEISEAEKTVLWCFIN
jgi:hypothetical protein